MAPFCVVSAAISDFAQKPPGEFECNGDVSTAIRVQYWIAVSRKFMHLDIGDVWAHCRGHVVGSLFLAHLSFLQALVQQNICHESHRLFGACPGATAVVPCPQWQSSPKSVLNQASQKGITSQK